MADLYNHIFKPIAEIYIQYSWRLVTKGKIVPMKLLQKFLLKIMFEQNNKANE